MCLECGFSFYFSCFWVLVCLPESVSLLDRALRNEWYTVIVLWASVVDSVPMDGYFHSFHMIFHVDDDLVVLAHLNAGSRNHTICCENTTLYTISQHALTMAPNCIGGVRCAHLTCSVNNKHNIYNTCLGYPKYYYLYFEIGHWIEAKVCIVVLMYVL